MPWLKSGFPKTNEQLTAVNNLITKKQSYESIAGANYNILPYQWQIDVTIKSLSNAKNTFRFLEHKQKEGWARSQDVNSALANKNGHKRQITAARNTDTTAIQQFKNFIP